MPKDPLVGRYFHTFNKKKEGSKTLNMQGRIIQALSDGYYLVETYEWIMGSTYAEYVVHISEMTRWNLYETHEWFVSMSKNLQESFPSKSEL